MYTRRELIAVLAAGTLVAKDYPVHRPTVEPLWKSPDGYPNALEASPEGLWVGEQITDVAYLLDWESGKVLRKIATDSSNTSGMAYGGGFLWMAANGPPLRRKPRPRDGTTGAVVKIDAKSGNTVARYPIPGGGGLHGLTWAENSLWVTTLTLKKLTQVDVDFNILRSIPVTLDRAHGLAWDDGSIWCVFSNDYVIQRLDAKDGRIIEAVQLRKESDPDPHGMTRYNGAFYYCDAGIGPGGVDSNSKYSGYICRIQI